MTTKTVYGSTDKMNQTLKTVSSMKEKILKAMEYSNDS